MSEHLKALLKYCAFFIYSFFNYDKYKSMKYYDYLTLKNLHPPSTILNLYIIFLYEKILAIYFPSIAVDKDLLLQRRMEIQDQTEHDRKAI